MSSKAPPPPLRSAKRLTAPPGAEERREHPRYELVAQLQLRMGGEVMLLDVGNISAGGMLIKLGAGDTADVKVGDHVSIFVDIGDGPDGKPLSVDAEAVVVRFAPSLGIGLRWVSSDPHFATRLERLLGRIGEVAVDD